jgi:fimbrial chaperone protein
MNRWSNSARLALASCFAILSPAVLAGGFQVTPTIGEIAPGARIATFQLHNNGSEPVSVQADAFAWSQDAQGETLAAAGNVVISPRITSLAPGQTTLVRVALRSPSKGGNAFRLKLRELPPPATSELNGVRTLIEHNIPLFFLADGAPALAWHARLGADGKLQLEGTNTGTRHYRATAIRIASDNGTALVNSNGPRYVLPHATTRWVLAAAGHVVRGDRIQVQLTGSDGNRDIPLVVE